MGRFHACVVAHCAPSVAAIAPGRRSMRTCLQMGAGDKEKAYMVRQNTCLRIVTFALLFAVHTPELRNIPVVVAAAAAAARARAHTQRRHKVAVVSAVASALSV